MHQYRIVRLQHLRSARFASALHTQSPQLKYNGGPLISNVEVFSTQQSSIRMVRSNFLISEFRVDGTRFLSGWCGHRFIENAHSWQIRVRQVNLIDCDQNLRNPSIVL